MSDKKLKLYNTMGRKMEEFKPIHEGFVGFYGCGPTVYNYAHIGNLRAYVFLDILDKTLSFLGYKLKHVMNITDVGHLSGDSDDGDDKMVKTAEEKHQTVMEIAKFYTDAFFNDIDRLNIRRPDVVCKATEHVNEMIELIKKLEANGHTYMAGGNLYYDVSTYADYGKLANLQLDELKEGAGRRKEVVIDENKRNPQDFALWFTKSKFENQALTWDSPWGRGYPGWHIECSAMSMKYLGQHFDIHTGGIDHVPVHHTNEIAQSEGSFSEEEKAKGPWVNYWLHNEFLVLQGATKMSKSSGNFLTLQSLVDKGYDALDYRFFLLGAHYRKQVYFSWEAMDGAKAGRKSLAAKVSKILAAAKIEKLSDLKKIDVKKAIPESIEQFEDNLKEDLNTPKALSTLQVTASGKFSKDNDAILASIKKMDEVLGLKVLETAIEVLEEQKKAAAAMVIDHTGDPEAAEIDALVAKRTEAKKNKDFETADKIRNELAQRGVSIIDTPNGVQWKRG